MSNDDEEPKSVICSRVEDMGVPPIQSVVRECCQCKRAIWISEGTLEGAERLQLDLWCMPCFLDDASKHNETVAVNALQESVAELKRHWDLRPTDEKDRYQIRHKTGRKKRGN